MKPRINTEETNYLQHAILYTAVDLMPTNKVWDLMDKPILSAKSVLNLLDEFDLPSYVDLINVQKTNLSLVFKKMVKDGVLHAPIKQGRINYYRVNWEKALMPILYNLRGGAAWFGSITRHINELKPTNIILFSEISNKYMRKFLIQHLRDELINMKRLNQLSSINSGDQLMGLILKANGYETKKYAKSAERGSESAELLKFSMNIIEIGSFWKGSTVHFWDKVILQNG